MARGVGVVAQGAVVYRVKLLLLIAAHRSPAQGTVA
ncbi:hypothetical protein A2U01_0103517, partial [Trifolium medium]|nr:hypothetical protein [Trifolium medium]